MRHRISRMWIWPALLTLALMLTGAGVPAAQADELTVFAAASTTNALTEIGEAFAKETGIKVVNSFASSSNLAKQIEQGAPAQIFVSADQKWMDYVAKAEAIVPETRVNLLKNRLVLIAPADSAQGEVNITADTDFVALLGDGRLAMGDPEHVPAGLYGKDALTSLGQWDKVKDKVAAAANVRVALALVETGEAPLGVVYATDAAISQKVKVVGMFPESSHKPIVYPAAVVKGAQGDAPAKYMAYLKGDAAKAVFAKYGFYQD